VNQKGDFYKMTTKQTDDLILDKNIKSKMQIKTLKSKMQGKKSYEELLDFYNQKQESFVKTSFFRKRLYVTIGFLLIMVLTLPLVPASDNDVDLFGFILSIAFLSLIVLIDQIVLGLYLFKTKKEIT